MEQRTRAVVTGARYALAAIRLVNGAAALFAPRFLSQRLGVDPGQSTGSIYALRLFGVRTIYIAAELALGRGDHLRDAMRIAPVIHASDVLSAASSGKVGDLPPKSSRMATIISTVNLVLAVIIALGAAREPSATSRLPRLPWRR